MIRGSLGASVDRSLSDPRRLGQADARFGDVDRENPAIAGRVPVQLVIALEATNLSGRAVTDDVTMLADRNERIGVADLNPDSVFTGHGRYRERRPLGYGS